ncbi:hypothetical protein OnM2_007017 [Erysiphe neolycopersici]|uniref:Uncharacterized protein n=1 Tax=Erysiphe neolycopersici TaxID=212602 RepID=A0A420I704_9PEZI|nr:hypothetical protein OnM2_007017 [Erysiphe neolycopersici]
MCRRYMEIDSRILPGAEVYHVECKPALRMGRTTSSLETVETFSALLQYTIRKHVEIYQANLPDSKMKKEI